MRDLRPRSPAAFLQPLQALQPHAFALEAAEQWALTRASALSGDLFRLSAFWHIDWFVQHLPTDRKTRYTARVVQSENYGIACGLTSVMQETGQAVALDEADHSLVGEDCREIITNRRYRTDLDRTAFIDLVMGQLPAQANDQLILNQERSDKYALKSQLFADEACTVLARKGTGTIKGNKPNVLVIGAMAGTHAALVARGFEVTATDMSTDVVGRSLGGVTVRNGSENDKLMEAADIVIVTGMTFPNGTLPDLMRAAQNSNTSTMIWAVTGRNLGHYYTVHGVDCVISDPAPFLQLPGPVSIGIWRREK
jgi:Putative heavy-metal chelation